MDDIIERLHKGAAYLKFFDCKDAADEITRLSARNAELRELLAAILKDPPDGPASEIRRVVNEQYEATEKARALLAKGEE